MAAEALASLLDVALRNAKSTSQEKRAQWLFGLLALDGAACPVCLGSAVPARAMLAVCTRIAASSGCCAQRLTRSDDDIWEAARAWGKDPVRAEARYLLFHLVSIALYVLGSLFASSASFHMRIDLHP